MDEWNGSDRRGGDERDHDLLIRIDSNLKSFMKKFDDHVIDDKTQFGNIYKMMGDNRKYIYMILGALVVINFLAEYGPKILKAGGN